MDLLDALDPHYDWKELACGKVEEVIPADDPELLGNYLVAISYHNANLNYSVITSKSVTEVLPFVIKNLIEWCSNKKATVETAACGSEYLSTRAQMEKIVDL